MFKALADPNRIALVAWLAIQRRARTVSEIVESGCCPVDFSVVSRHLRTLHVAGVVDAEKTGREVRYTLDELSKADVVYALRMQRERMGGGGATAWVPSLREYAACYQINGRRLSPRQLLMHPGPVNRGVELSGEVVDSPQALITAQVQAGVVVRMAVLYELLSGAHVPRPVPERQLA